MKGFGERIKKHRKLKNLTQEELGNLLGVTKSYISKVESESTIPKLEMFINISEKLGVDVGDLIGGKKITGDEIGDSGIDWMILGEELEEQGITMEQVKMWAQIAKAAINKDQ